MTTSTIIMTTSEMCQAGKAGYYCRRGNVLENRGIREVLAANLKETRRTLGLTQEELAEKARVSTHYIAMIETCKKYPKPDMLEHIAKTLNIAPHRLFSVETDLDEPFEQLYQKIIIGVQQIVNEAVEKAVSAQCKGKE